MIFVLCDADVNQSLQIAKRQEIETPLQLIRELSDSQIENLKATGTATVGGHQITADEIRIRYNTKTEGDNQYEAGSEGSLLVLLNLSLTQQMKDEGVAREFIARCQVFSLVFR